MYFKMASWQSHWMVRWEVGCEIGFSQHDFWEEMPLCLRNALTQVQIAKLESHHCHIDLWTGQENAHISKTLKGGLRKMQTLPLSLSSTDHNGHRFQDALKFSTGYERAHCSAKMDRLYSLGEIFKSLPRMRAFPGAISPPNNPVYSLREQAILLIF